MLKGWLLGVFICCFGTSAMWGAESTPPLRQAIQSFQGGDYTTASEIYLARAMEQANGSLFHNLGLSFYRAGERGAAMAAYLRAFQLRPRDPDIQFNLKFLLAKGSDQLEAQMPKGDWESYLCPLALNIREYFLLFVSCFLVTGGLAALWVWTRKSVLILPLVIAAVLLSYVGAGYSWTAARQQDWGAITVAKAGVFTGPTDKNALVIFELHEGAPFAVVEQSEDWLKLRISDGKTGWVKNDQVAVFGAKYKIYQKLKALGGKTPEAAAR